MLCRVIYFIDDSIRVHISAGVLSAGRRRTGICAFRRKNQISGLLRHTPRRMEGDNVLKYLWMVTQDLFLTVTYVTWMHALLGRIYGHKARVVHGAAVLAGTAAAAGLAAAKYNTNKIISSHWNHYIYAVYLILILLFLFLCLVFGRTENRLYKNDFLLLTVVGSCVSAVLIFYALPGVLLYPFSFNTMGNGYLSEYYLVRLAGWVLGLVLLLIYSRLLYHCSVCIMPYRILPAFLNAGLITYGIYCFGRFFVPWVNRAKWLNWPVRYDRESYGWAGSLMLFTANYAMLFIWIGAGLAVVMVVLFFMKNVKVKEAYDNPAQKRLLRARNRRNRRRASGVAVSVVLCVLIITVVKAYDTRVVELSAPETYTVDGDTILISMEEVSDGHLHRFEYKTENNIDVRWIVVKKPGSASFGVGLDACEVCGNAGYFERSGQVICRRCDVVMNINTIGFKGGCNPIPLAYEVSGGNLVFRLEDIIAGEKEFR